MPSYKLIYFDARGRAEPTRMLFALKGQDFDDHRFAYEEWPTLKKDKKCEYEQLSLEKRL